MAPMSLKEINWLNKYHKKVYNIFNKKLTSSEKLWLKKATSPLDYN